MSVVYGEIDKSIRNRYRGRWLVCPKGHLNSPNAKICDKCGSTDLLKEDIRNIHGLIYNANHNQIYNANHNHNVVKNRG